MHQRLAGNGFECTNEPWVHLGLGGIERIDSVEIQWPSGKKSLLSNVLPNRRYLAIESLDTLTEDPLAQPTP
jgi:hypothetical protein